MAASDEDGDTSKEFDDAVNPTLSTHGYETIRHGALADTAETLAAFLLAR